MLLAAREAHQWGPKENGLARGAVDYDYKGKGLQLQFIVKDEGVFIVALFLFGPSASTEDIGAQLHTAGLVERMPVRA